MHYPSFSRLLRELDVRSQPTDMSLSVSCGGCGLRYSSGSGLRALPRGLAGPGSAEAGSGAALAGELARFNASARALLAGADGSTAGLTLEKFLADGSFTPAFVGHVVLPLVAIVWSCDLATAGRYPASALLAFLDNHGMLAAGAATRWRTITGGSRSYVDRVARALTEVRAGTPVTSVRRGRAVVEVRDRAGGARAFDRDVIAVHPHQALALLADPTQAERDVLSSLPYLANRAVLHTDPRLLPPDEMCRAAWNHRQSSCSARDATATVTYDLNRLQNLPAATPYLVTLGDSGQVDPASVLARMDYEHPLYTVESAAARSALPELSTGMTAFAGAYHGWGFHEDGCRSGLAAAAALGAEW